MNSACSALELSATMGCASVKETLKGTLTRKLLNRRTCIFPQMLTGEA